MNSLSKVLVVGSGPAGLSAAISLARAGVRVEIAEIRPDRSVLGSELLISSPILRALNTLGIAHKCAERGVAIMQQKIHDEDDSVVAAIDFRRVTDASLPPGLGITRKNLTDVMYDEAVSLGVTINHCSSIANFTLQPDSVEVVMRDGRCSHFDLLIGADGVQSVVRQQLYPAEIGPTYVGQCVWRARIPTEGEPALRLWEGADCVVGIITVSEEWSYLFGLVSEKTIPRLNPDDFHKLLRSRLEPFKKGIVASARDRLGGPSEIHFSPMLAFVLRPPWYKGRVVLLGDAAHAATPHVAYGAGLAIEDGVVLGDAFQIAPRPDDALQDFMRRRYSRCEMVVSAGIQISRWHQESSAHLKSKQVGLTDATWARLAEPI